MPIDLAKANINSPAVVNRHEASINGGNSMTAILFKRYVDPQITYMAKKASITRAEFEDFPIARLVYRPTILRMFAGV
jgi:hypothetical protein